MQAGPDTESRGRWIVVPILVAGVLGGMVWAAIVALLRDRFNANEILVSLMLVYVAELLLGYLVYGPLEGPAGLQLPADHHLRGGDADPAALRRQPAREHRRADRARARSAAFWVLLFRTYAGFQLQVGGLAPAAARYAGFSLARARCGRRC